MCVYVCVCVWYRLQVRAKVTWLESMEKAAKVTDGDGVMGGRIVCHWGSESAGGGGVRECMYPCVCMLVGLVCVCMLVGNVRACTLDLCQCLTVSVCVNVCVCVCVCSRPVTPLAQASAMHV